MVRVRLDRSDNSTREALFSDFFLRLAIMDGERGPLLVLGGETVVLMIH